MTQASTRTDGGLTRAATAGVAYMGVMFAAGFVLGTLRVLVLVPRLGETAAVALELPLMLGLSWLACGAVVRRWRVATTASARLAMGGVALLLLLAAEFVLGTVMAGGDPFAPLRAWATPAGALGLAAQCLFGLFPLLRARAYPLG
jgi:hypothetical protein